MCKHEHGAKVDGLNSWVCGQCFEMLPSRPKRYQTYTTVADADGPRAPRQEVIWEAAVRRSEEGLNLDQFLASMARRFMKQDESLDTFEAHKLSLDVVRSLDLEFGDPDIEWSRVGAIDIAEEEMTYWDGELVGAN